VIIIQLSRLLDRSTLEKYDSQQMYKVYDRWPEIAKNAYEAKYDSIEFKEIDNIDGDILSKLIYLIYLLDYTSIYKAVITKIDPSPIKPIDFIKSKL